MSAASIDRSMGNASITGSGDGDGGMAETVAVGGVVGAVGDGLTAVFVAGSVVSAAVAGGASITCGEFERVVEQAVIAVRRKMIQICLKYFCILPATSFLR